MKKLFLSAAAVLAGAGVAATADAAATPPLQMLRCTAGRAPFKENVDARQGIALGTYVNQGPMALLTIRGQMHKPGKNGAGSSTTLSLVMVNPGDPRTATFPVTVSAGGQGTFVGGAYVASVTKDVLKGPEVQLETTTTSWQIDPFGAPAFSVTLLKWDAATMRLSGKFAGTMRPADGAPLGQKPLKMRAGKFSVTVPFDPEM
jgi:hypothetical protein